MKTIVLLLFIASAVDTRAQTNGNAGATNRFKSLPAPVTAPVVGVTNTLRIVSIDGMLSTYHRCQTSVGTIYLAGLPTAAKVDHDTVIKLQTYLAAEQDYVKREAKRIRDAKARLPNRYEFDSPVDLAHGNLDKQQELLQNRVADNDEVLDKLKAARQRWAAASEVTAFDTGRVYGVIPVWQIIPARSKP